ncbi:hypothetical protein [Paenibacillus sp. UNC499MF]|uniref:hypothetical protein n=1 Tax=Paenibacillus sp. UNC499MF TaxID=1502751 RepID=UPI0011B0B8C3|nr:hypothetical protein [Paenibacillus sp. UNC499MF]
MTIIIGSLLGIVAVVLVIGLNVLEKKHEEEIKAVISKKGGVVLKIERVEPKTSAFKNDFNRSNVIYRIIYKNNVDSELLAWYRGINVPNNIHGDNPTAREGRFREKWIFQSELK